MAAANAYEKMKKRRERVQGLTQSNKGLNYSLKKRSPSLRDDKSDTVSQSSTEEVVHVLCFVGDFFPPPPPPLSLSLSLLVLFLHIVSMFLVYMILTRKRSR